MPPLTPAQQNLLDAVTASTEGVTPQLSQSRPAKTLIRFGLIEARTGDQGRRTLHAVSSPANPPEERAAPPATAASSKAAPGGKIAIVLGLLRRPDGATLAELMSATGWQSHSVRGAIAGAIKKKLGVPVASVSRDGVRTYSIAADR